MTSIYLQNWEDLEGVGVCFKQLEALSPPPSPPTKHAPSVGGSIVTLPQNSPENAGCQLNLFGGCFRLCGVLKRESLQNISHPPVPSHTPEKGRFLKGSCTLENKGSPR